MEFPNVVNYRKPVYGGCPTAGVLRRCPTAVCPTQIPGRRRLIFSQVDLLGKKPVGGGALIEMGRCFFFFYSEVGERVCD